MELWSLLIVGGIVIAIGVAVAATLGRRGTSVDKPDDRGPYSSGTAARADFPPFNTTYEDPPKAQADGGADVGRDGDGVGGGDGGDGD